MKINYNSPFILTFALICSAVFAFKLVAPNFVDYWFVLSGQFNFSSFRDFFGLFSYPLNHGSLNHLFGNMSFILLLGPAIEERYGGKNLLFMIIITSIVTGVFNILLFDTGIIGASGIVFLFIVLISFNNNQGKGIPLTFILIVLIFLGKEVIESFNDDNISQFGHLVGGACGALFGLNPVFFRRNKTL